MSTVTKVGMSHKHAPAPMRWYQENKGEQIISTCQLCHRALGIPLDTAQFSEAEILAMPVLYQVGDRRPFVLWGAPEYIYNEKVRAQRNLKVALGIMSPEQVRAYRQAVEEK